MRRTNGFVAVLALVSAALCMGAQPADRDPVLTGCRDALLAQVESLRAALPEMTRAADIAADRLLGSGALYAAGREAFVSEARERAGGLMMLDPLTETTPLSAKDVLLVGAPAASQWSPSAMRRRPRWTVPSRTCSLTPSGTMAMPPSACPDTIRGSCPRRPCSSAPSSGRW